MFNFDSIPPSVEWLKTRTILVTITGSFAYGTNVETSDIDYKGVCIPPEEYYYGLKTFNDYNTTGGKNWKNTKEDVDVSIMHINKFVSDAMQGVPNNLEILFVRPKDMIYKNRFGEELIAHRHDFLSKALKHKFGGYAHSQLQKLIAKGNNGTGRQDLIEKYGYDCYHEDTMFLTNSGWKQYDDIKDEDLLGTVNPVTWQIEFKQAIERVKKKYSGKMYNIQNRFSEVLVTPNHRMYVSNCHRNPNTNYSTKYNNKNSLWYYDSVINLINSKNSYYHILTRITPHDNDYDIDDDYLILLGCYLSEGTFGHKERNKKSVRISQTSKGKPEFIEAMDKISEKYDFKKYEYYRKDKKLYEYTWVSHNQDIVQKLYDECGCLSANLKMPQWFLHLSKRQSEILLNALYLGDGSKYDNNKTIYYTSSTQLASDVQTLAFIAGYNANIWDYKERHGTYQVYYTDYFDQAQSIVLNHKTLHEDCNCNIVCFTVPNENLITKFNGKIAIQGNTKFYLHAVRLLTSAIEIFKTGDFSTYRTNREELLACRNGRDTLEQAVAYIQELDKELNELYETSNAVPHKPDYNKINTWLIDLNKRAMTEEW